MKKNNVLKGLKAFYSFCTTRSKNEQPIEKVQSDHKSKLQSHKIDKWLQRKRTVFEPSPPYFQEENNISERVRKTIMDLIKAKVLRANFDHKIWSKILLSMMYIKKNRLTKALQVNNTLQEAQSQKLSNLSPFQLFIFAV